MMIATTAKAKPKTAPILKLKIAATTARIEGMLKTALDGALELMV